MGKREAERLKVIHVIAPAGMGGAESLVRNVAMGTRQSDMDIEIAALVNRGGNHAFLELAREDGTIVHPVITGRRRYLQQIRALTSIFEATGAHAVHTHVYHANMIGFQAARRCNLPVVATIHGFTGGTLKNRFYEWADLQLLRWFSGVTCASEGIRRRVVGAGSRPNRVIVVPNCHNPQPLLSRQDARLALGLDQDVPVIGWVGRLSHEKGPDQLLEAVTKFSSPRPVTAVIGEGPLSGHLCQRATRLGLDDGSVRLMGQRGNAARLYQAFDLLVMSSRAEGTPLVLLEAMAAGIPVVCFAVGGIPDVIDNASGWLVPAGDIGALTYAIEHALSDRAEAEKRATAAQQIFLERYSIQRYLSILGEFYRRVIPMVPS